MEFASNPRKEACFQRLTVVRKFVQGDFRDSLRIRFRFDCFRDGFEFEIESKALHYRCKRLSELRDCDLLASEILAEILQQPEGCFAQQVAGNPNDSITDQLDDQIVHRAWDETGARFKSQVVGWSLYHA